jgi:hypothetical protein
LLAPAAFLLQNFSSVRGIAQRRAENLQNAEDRFRVSVDALLVRVDIRRLNSVEACELREPRAQLAVA